MPAILKTVGVLRPDGLKDFELHLANGETVLAIRNGGKFQVGGVVDTLKSIKLQVENGLRNQAGELFSVDEVPEPTNTPPDLYDVWEQCVDPCAIIVRAVAHGLIPLEGEVMKTLDNHGWLANNGDVDIDRSTREYDRIQNDKQ